VRTLNLTGNYLLRLVGVVRSRSAEHSLFMSSTPACCSEVEPNAEAGIVAGKPRIPGGKAWRG
jgi:hypothetical protein